MVKNAIRTGEESNRAGTRRNLQRQTPTVRVLSCHLEEFENAGRYFWCVDDVSN